MRRPTTLAGQALALQLVVIAVVLVVVAMVSVTQAQATFTRTESRRVLAVAEDVAADGVLRQALAAPVASTRNPVTAVAESARQVSGASQVVVTGPDLRVLTATDLALVGSTLPTTDLDGDAASDVAEGRSWTGITGLGDGPSAVTAHVPVIADDGRVIGAVAVTRDRPGLLDRLGEVAPDLLTFLGLASLLGVTGSYLLARRVKRQTLGMEPGEIAGLVRQREAMLLGIREGVLVVDVAGRVALVNDAARRLLGLPADAAGRALDELDLEPELRAALAGEGPDPEDLLVMRDDAVVVLNRRAVISGGAREGWISTLRDRTELVGLQRELGTTRGTSETLRAQAHEFSNRLHTISGLIEIGEYDEVVRYLGVLQSAAGDDAMITGRVADPALAALLVAKVRLARERGAVLEVDGLLEGVDADLSADLVTVVGNLVDNGLDAAMSGPGDPRVVVTFVEGDDGIGVRVEDTGPGITADPPESVFARGVSTKEGTRGFGLSLVRVVAVRRGGRVAVGNRGEGPGAAFTVRLPRGPVPVAAAP